MATVPTMHTFTTGEIATAANINNNTVTAWNFLSAPVLCVMRQTVAQSLAFSTWNMLLLDTNDLDRDGGHSTISNTSRYVCKTAGWYWMASQCNIAANASGVRAIVFQINGSSSSRYAKNSVQPNTGGSNTAPVTTTVLFLNVNDYVETGVYQYPGSSTNLNTVVTDDGNPRFTLRWVST